MLQKLKHCISREIKQELFLGCFGLIIIELTSVPALPPANSHYGCATPEDKDY